MEKNDASRELARIEFRRISSIAWPFFAILYSIQAFATQGSLSPWQFYYALGIGATLGLSLLIGKFTDIEFNFLPQYLYMILFPLFLGTTPEKPWMSLGLVNLAFVVYLSVIENVKVAIALNLLVCVFQSWQVFQPSTSYTDLSDMQLLHSYFAFTWTIWLGLSALFIRNRYLKADEKIENSFEQSIEQVAGRVQRINLANRRDYRNLQLHGTILNNLIFFNNRKDFGQENFDLKGALTNDLSALLANDSGPGASSEERLATNIARRTLRRVKIKGVEIDGEFQSGEAETIAFEVVREVLLNLEKHSDASTAQIKISALPAGKVVIEISDNSTDQISDALESNSLRRLISGFGGVLSAFNGVNGYAIKRKVELNLEKTPIEIGQSILEIRNSSLTDFALNFGRSAVLYGIFAIPGYLAIGTSRISSAILTVQNILIAIPAVNRKRFGKLLLPSVLLSLLVVPYFSLTMQACSEIEFFPWIFNTILAGAFLVAIDAKNSFTRWFPIAIFTAEALFLPRMFPSGCRTIFVGSLPAIPLIIFFAYALLNLRRSWVKKDADEVSDLLENSKSQAQIEEQINSHFDYLLTSLSDFANRIDKEGDEKKVSEEVSLFIQRIRAFLIASEQYESAMVRDLHRFVINRLGRGISTKFALHGSNFFRSEGQLDISEALAEIDGLLLDRAIDISLARDGGIKLFMSIERLNPELEKKILALFADSKIKIELDGQPQLAVR